MEQGFDAVFFAVVIVLISFALSLFFTQNYTRMQVIMLGVYIAADFIFI